METQSNAAMNQVHPTAVIEDGAQIADDAHVGPMCYVGANATLGSGTRLISHVVVLGRTTLGKSNTVWPHTVLGGQPQDFKYRGEDSQLVIGDNNEIRESVTIHLGTDNGGGVTRIGSDNLLMVGTHVAHDCVIGDHVVLANLVQLAGHIHIEDHVVISGASGFHHFVTVGQYAFVGGMSRVVHDVPPFMILEGHPSKVRGVNTIGLTRNQFPQETIRRLKDAYRRLFRSSAANGKDADSTSNMAQALAKLQDDYPDDECIMLLARFIKHSSIGLFGRYREGQRQDSRRQKPVESS